MSLTTADGMRLAAWYVPSRNGAAVIAFPGRQQPVPHAVYLDAAGAGGELWRAKGGHTGALAAQPADYELRVVGFFDRAL